MTYEEAVKECLRRYSIGDIVDSLGGNKNVKIHSLKFYKEVLIYSDYMVRLYENANENRACVLYDSNFNKFAPIVKKCTPNEYLKVC